MRSLFTALVLTTAFIARAEPAADVTLATAEHLASAARVACRALGREVAVAVVDASGQTLLMSRPASVGPHNLEAARRKAYTALTDVKPPLLTVQVGTSSLALPIEKSFPQGKALDAAEAGRASMNRQSYCMKAF